MSVLAVIYRCLGSQSTPAVVRITALCQICLCRIEVFIPPTDAKPSALRCPCGCEARELKIMAAQALEGT